MLFIIGSTTVLVCVLGGYVAMGGHLAVLWQPFEAVIIVGAAVGAFIISNPKTVLGRTGKAMGAVLRGSRYTKESYLELLSLQYQVFKIAKTRGLLALEQHIEKPDESALFQQFPKFYSDHHAVVFLCDYLRLMSLGSDNPNELESLMEEELETHPEEHAQISGAIQTMADGMPALGIVAAVLGVIKTMASINAPVEVLGAMIGGALVGTFLGVFLSYGFVGPIAARLGQTYDQDGQFYTIIRDCLVAYLQGHSAPIAVELARGNAPTVLQPSFQEMDELIGRLPADPLAAV
jgi:chemotaxis protein MotA